MNFHPLLKPMIVLIPLWLLLVACTENSNDEAADNGTENGNVSAQDNAEASQEETRNIYFSGYDYDIPARADRLMIADESMLEEALMLGVEPAGARQQPLESDLFSDITEHTEAVDPENYENLLEFNPDIVLYASAQSPDEFEDMQAIAPTIIVPLGDGSVWEERLQLLAEITGNEEQVEPAITHYYDLIDEARSQIETEDKTILTLRLRSDDAAIYPEDTYVNNILYQDIGFDTPEELLQINQQETITLEGIASIDPDYLFVQVTDHGMAAWEELQDSNVWGGITAVEEDRVYVNIMEPELSGITAYSKTLFLEGVLESLTE